MEIKEVERTGFTTEVSKDWRLSLYEILAVVGVAMSVSVAVTIWCMTTFQTKGDAALMKADLEKQIGSNRDEINNIKGDFKQFGVQLGNVSNSVEYIRGRLEPKTHQ